MRATLRLITLLAGCVSCSAPGLFSSNSPPTADMLALSKLIEIKSHESIKVDPKSHNANKTPALPAPGTVILTLKTSALLNPNAMQNAAPVRVWIFELDKFEKFTKAEQSALVNNPEKILGSDLRRSRDVVLAPEELVNLQWQVQTPGFIGVLADFRKPPTQLFQQRQLIAFDAKSSLSWKIILSGNTLVSLANAQPDKTPVNIDNDLAQPRVVPGLNNNSHE
jgi:type VI secretion system VasD/TssJ family lipoprotein